MPDSRRCAGAKGERIAAFVLALLCAAAVLWVRTVPLSLPVIDDLAADLASQREATDPTGNLEAVRSAIAEEIKSYLRYEGRDGRQYVYLGDYDSYLWLRNARNTLRTGSPCDAVVAGECRDSFGMAPVGSSMIYHPSLHTDAIATLHRAITRFEPGFPLAASAYLVPVLLSVLGALAAFALGRLLAGNMGGVFAALLVSFNTEFLTRSLGSDNDVWNVVLPIFMFGAALAALSTRNVRWQWALALAAGAFAVLHGAVWSGWILPYGILVAALIACVASEAVREAITSRSARVWRGFEVQRSARVLLVFWLGAGLFSSLAGHADTYLDVPSRLLQSALGPWIELAPAPDGPVDLDMWPNTFATVHELQQFGLRSVAMGVGGHAAFLGGLVGLLLLALPRDVLTRRHQIALLTGALVLAFLVFGWDTGRGATVGILALLFLATFALSWLEDEAVDRVSRASVVVIAAWLLSTLYAAFEGLRFVMFVAPPFALVFAVVAGRVFAGLGSVLDESVPRRAALARAALFAGMTSFLIAPVLTGYDLARRYVPMINDTWWGALERLRDESAPDAIVNAWWDYGYWIKYVAERRVSLDGGSLGTHVPYWIGRAMATPDEAESVGLLRMLNCGSDATPNPEGKLGAYGKLTGAGVDALRAHDMIVDLARLGRAEAEQYLAARNFEAGIRAAILETTHCDPPESYLLLDGEQVHRAAGWLHHGLWDVRRALVARELQRLPPAEAVRESVARLGISEAEATGILDEARRLSSAKQVSEFVSTMAADMQDRWIPCVRSAEGPVVCDAVLPIRAPEIVLQRVVYHEAQPEQAELWTAGDASRPETPGAVVVGGRERIEEFRPASPSAPRVGLLVDVPNARVLVGAPQLIRSMFVKLLFLDGRHWSHFEKFDERTSYTGAPLAIWRINWAGRPSVEVSLLPRAWRPR